MVFNLIRWEGSSVTPEVTRHKSQIDALVTDADGYATYLDFALVKLRFSLSFIVIVLNCLGWETVVELNK